MANNYYHAKNSITLCTLHRVVHTQQEWVFLSELWLLLHIRYSNANQVEIAIQETGAQVTKREFDYLNGDKPAWYTERINPLGKVCEKTYSSKNVVSRFRCRHLKVPYYLLWNPSSDRPARPRVGQDQRIIDDYGVYLGPLPTCRPRTERAR